MLAPVLIQPTAHTGLEKQRESFSRRVNCIFTRNFSQNNMKTFTFWDNSKTMHGKMLLKVKASDILEADKALKQKTGHDPTRCSWIGCTIELDIEAQNP